MLIKDDDLPVLRHNSWSVLRYLKLTQRINRYMEYIKHVLIIYYQSDRDHTLVFPGFHCLASSAAITTLVATTMDIH